MSRFAPVTGLKARAIMHTHSLSALSIFLLVLTPVAASVLLWVIHDLSTRRRSALDDAGEPKPPLNHQLSSPATKIDRNHL